MIKYFDGETEISEQDIYFIVQNNGTAILDDFKQVEFSDCCEASLDIRTHYRRPIKICSNCKKDILK